MRSGRRNRLGIAGTCLAATAVLVYVPAVSAAPGPMSASPDRGAAAAPAVSAFRPQFRPTIDVRHAPGPIRIDGVLDDPGWEGAARADGFVETSPGDQVRPPVESEAWVTFDDRKLYLALVARDDPRSVRVSLRDRDQIWSDDYFGLMLDTYGDASWGYEFFVNPYGIQGDLRMRTGGEEDIFFDLLWESKGRVTEDGYEVEIAIPFSSLRFPDREEQVWRVNFWRDHQREVRRRYAWAAIDRDDPCAMCQWGTLTGIRGLRARRPFDVIAALVGTQSGQREEARFRNEAAEGQVALTLRYPIGPNAAAEAAFNPDFSQVESDAGQIDVNEPFAISYPEKRPFFQEGADLFETPVDVVYTRSINRPEEAGKLGGRFGRTSFAWLAARDEASPIPVPLDERGTILEGGRSTLVIGRLKRALGEEEHLGTTVTGRWLDGGGSGLLGSVDGRVRLSRNLTLQGQAAVSRTSEPIDPAASARVAGWTFDRGTRTAALDGETFSGTALYTGLVRSGRRWNGEVEYTALSPTFRAENGSVERNDYRELSTWNGIYLRPNRGWLLEWEPSVALGRIWNDRGGFEDEWAVPGLTFHLVRQFDLRLERTWSRERFRGRILDGIRVSEVSLSGQPGEALGVGLEASWGRRIRRTFAEDPFLGRTLDLSAEASWKPSERLLIEPSVSYSRMRTPDGGDLVYRGHILRTRVGYQFTRELFARLVVEYDDFEESLLFEPLVTFRLDAFSVVYAGMSGRYLERADEEPVGGSGLQDRLWRLDSRQIFAKIQYLFRI